MRPPTSAAPATLIGAVLALVVSLAPAPASALIPDDFGGYQGQVSCDPHAKPGVAATRNLILDTFGGRDLGITRACGVGGTSEHKEGRAWDYGLNWHKKSERRRAERVLTWLTEDVDGEPAARARSLGVMYAIWAGRIWRSYDPVWRRYDGSSPHRDHIHLSFTWNGATKQTAWWTGEPQPTDYGPCQKWTHKPARPWKAPNLEPCPPALERPTANKRGIYRAQHGETPNRVARFFDKTPEQIRRWNDWPATGDVDIWPGDKVWVVRPH